MVYFLIQKYLLKANPFPRGLSDLKKKNAHPLPRWGSEGNLDPPSLSLRSPWASLSHKLINSHQILLILFPKYLLICPLPPATLSLISIGLVI